VRETLYDDLSPGRRTDLHARAGAALEALRPGVIQALAHHFVCAGKDLAKAVEYAEAAAREATARLAFEDAIEILDRVMEIVPVDDAQTRKRIFTARAPASTGLWHAVYEGSQLRVAGPPAGQPTT
jgi:predicted ATPase